MNHKNKISKHSRWQVLLSMYKVVFGEHTIDVESLETLRTNELIA